MSARAKVSPRSGTPGRRPRSSRKPRPTSQRSLSSRLSKLLNNRRTPSCAHRAGQRRRLGLAPSWDLEGFSFCFRRSRCLASRASLPFVLLKGLHFAVTSAFWLAANEKFRHKIMSLYLLCGYRWDGLHALGAAAVDHSAVIDRGRRRGAPRHWPSLDQPDDLGGSPGRPRRGV